MAKHTVVYPGHRFTPEDLLNFSELDWFRKNWEKLELTEADLCALQILIMFNPKGAPLIQGTGGLRKLRFAPPEWNVGKSGALRVCYVYFEKYGWVTLATVYGKDEKDNLSSDDKKTISKLIKRIAASLKKRFDF